MGLSAHIGVDKFQRPPHMMLLCSITCGKLCFADALHYSISSVLHSTSVPHRSMHPASLQKVTSLPACGSCLVFLHTQVTHHACCRSALFVCTALQALATTANGRVAKQMAECHCPLFCCPFCSPCCPLFCCSSTFCPLFCCPVICCCCYDLQGLCRFNPQQGAAIQTAYVVYAGGHWEGEVYSDPEAEFGQSL